MDEHLTGKLLIADPFLKDPSFKRSVVFLCEDKEEGSFGFVLNRKFEQPLSEILEGAEDSPLPVYYGGPVQIDTLHYLHLCPDLIPGGIEVVDGIYWGGDFEIVVDLVKANALTTKDIRFFIGYSGWSEGQLAEEMKIKSWITSEGNRKLVFTNHVDDTWKKALKQLGGEYVQMVNYPIDPQLN